MSLDLIHRWRWVCGLQRLEIQLWLGIQAVQQWVRSCTTCDPDQNQFGIVVKHQILLPVISIMIMKFMT
jgi:hypothetical protein